MAVRPGKVRMSEGLEPGQVLGLSAEEATRRLTEDGPNELPSAKPRNLWQQTIDVMREPMLMLLVGAAVINFILSEKLDGLILGTFVLVVVAISIYQEHKTESALIALRDLSAPRALVLRDGQRIRVPGTEVVRGDHVLLVEGDRVPADGVLITSASFSVDESTLTGEAVPVRKRAAGAGAARAGMGRPGGDDTPWVFSGTLVVRGHGLAVIEQTGASTELGRIGKALGSIEVQRTPLQREVDRLVRVVALAGAVAATAVVVVYGLTRGHWLAGLLAGIAAAMAMLPEEFPVVLTVFLAMGAWRMSQKHVLTRRSPVMETLGSATVICVDKTGTLTMNRMTVQDLVCGGVQHVLDERPLPEAFHAIAEYAVLASPINPFDPMDRAFHALGGEYLVETGRLHPDWQLVREYPLSEGLMALAHAWRTPVHPHYVIAAKGAPEAIATLCRFDDARRARLIAEVEAATENGQRVLAVARATYDGASDLPEEQRAFAFDYLGLAGLHDPVRPGVATAVRDCERAGVRTVMITGDYPGTAMAIAREIGLHHEAGFITGPELDAMSEGELAARVRTVSVFARMVPEQKLQLVRALKANGEVVGMTGDGVNDAPALRAADIGIAMGARGTDVARESAALVITDDDFSSIASGVRQGRGIFDNLRKAMTYVIAVHVPIFGMALVPVFVADWPLVLLPLQIALLELIIDPACSVVFEAEQIDPHIMDRPPRGVGAPMFDRRTLLLAVAQGASMLAAILAVYLWAVFGGCEESVVRSCAFVTLVVGNVLLILVNRSHRLSAVATLRKRANPTVKWIVTGAAFMLIGMLGTPALRASFHLGALTPGEALVSVLAGIVGVSWFEVHKALAPGSGS